MVLKRVGAFVLATLAVALFTAIIRFSGIDANVANVSMLYLIVVIACALLLGRGPAIWSSLVSFFAFNYFFVKPKYTLVVAEETEWIALCMFLLIATVTGQLMAMLKSRAQEARQHQQESAALAEASWAVASQLDTDSALMEVLKQVARVVQLDVVAVVVIKGGGVYTVSLSTASGGAADGQKEFDVLMKHLPEKAVDLSSAAPVVLSPPICGTDSRRNKYGSDFVKVERAIGFTIPDELCRDNISFLPIVLNNQTLGFVFIELSEGKTLSAGQRQIIDSLIGHSAVILQRDELIETKTRAAALIDADRLKTALLSMVSHDFRSPLTSIKASVSTLLEDGEPLDPETQRGLYQAIDQETDRLNRMVGNILDLSRLESDAWRPRIETTPLSELLGMTLDAFDEAANKRIEVHLDSELNEVAVDCVQMIQVLKNLIENALKYSDQSKTVELITRKIGKTACIEILDRGPGFAGANAEQLFEPFWRAPHLQESNVPGLGIGLAVCRGLVLAHEGTLTFENRDGGGSIFRVTLPLKE